MPSLLYGLPLLLVWHGRRIRSRGCRDGHLVAKQASVGRGYIRSAIPRNGGAFPSRTTRKICQSHCRVERGHHPGDTLLARSIHPAQQLYGEKFVSRNNLFHRRKGRHSLHHTSGSKAFVLHPKHLQRPTTAIHILTASQ